MRYRVSGGHAELSGARCAGTPARESDRYARSVQACSGVWAGAGSEDGDAADDVSAAGASTGAVSTGVGAFSAGASFFSAAGALARGFGAAGAAFFSAAGAGRDVPLLAAAPLPERGAGLAGRAGGVGRAATGRAAAGRGALAFAAFAAWMRARRRSSSRFRVRRISLARMRKKNSFSPAGSRPAGTDYW